MNIVVEGPDGAGKSTLCYLLSQELGREVIGGEGPSKYLGEFDERIIRMSVHKDVIFDRHAAVSGPIYNQFKEGPQDFPSVPILQSFYGSGHLMLYCHPTKLSQHVANNSAVDTPDYLEWLGRYDAAIKHEYEAWALRHADVIYRIGDSIKQLVKMLKGAI